MRSLLRTVETMTMPLMKNPVKNLSTANIMKVVEKALAMAKSIPNTYDTSSMIFRPNLRRGRAV